MDRSVTKNSDAQFSMNLASGGATAGYPIGHEHVILGDDHNDSSAVNMLHRCLARAWRILQIAVKEP